MWAVMWPSVSTMVQSTQLLLLLLFNSSSSSSDSVAYAALLRNELLGAGMEALVEPHPDDRRQAVLTPRMRSLFRVGGGGA